MNIETLTKHFEETRVDILSMFISVNDDGNRLAA